MIKTICKQRELVLLFVVLLIQVLTLGYLAKNKAGMHIDEHYSYILSNSFDAACVSAAPEFWYRWLDGSDFREFLTVENGERFAYRSVYNNNAKDAHPPLFYFLLHTVCSLFPGIFSPWMGIGMNIVLIVLVQLVLFRFGKALTGSALWAVLPVAIYGGMQVFVDTALFIRMYSLMTLLTVLLTEQHYWLAVSDEKAGAVIKCFILTFLGTFTQYYFVFIAFFMAAATCFYLLSHKQWKWLAFYSAAMLLAVLSVFLVFPAGITQITGSETNNVGNEIASSILDFSGFGTAMKSMLSQSIVGMFKGVFYCLSAAVILALITVVASVRLRPSKDEVCYGANKKQSLTFSVILAGILALTVATVTHISGRFTFVRYLYNLFPLVALLCGVIVCLILGTRKLNKEILVLGMIAVWLMSTCAIAKNNGYSYLYTDRAADDNVIIEQCADKPTVVLNNGITHHPTALLHILQECDQMYMANYNDMEQMDAVLSQVDSSNGVVFLVLTDTYWSDGFDGDVLMDEIMESSDILGSYHQFSASDFTTAYMAFPEENNRLSLGE